MRVCSILLAMLALAAPAAARADYVEDYIAGLAALDHGDYVLAVQNLKKALAAQSEPVQRVMIQGNAQPYLPHHFLGLAQFKLGDCAAAQAEWNDPMNARMLALLKQLRVRQALLRGQRQDLADERELLAQEQRLLGQCVPAAAKSTTQQSTQTADKPPAATSAPPATSASPPATPAPPPKPAVVAPAGTPPALLRAFDDFVAGRYANAAKLDADALSGTRARFQAFLLRSAARFALARSGDKGQLDAARRDARAAQALDKSAPDERVFSPAFRAFYAQAQ
jgi:hypothetical protein